MPESCPTCGDVVVQATRTLYHCRNDLCDWFEVRKRADASELRAELLRVVEAVPGLRKSLEPVDITKDVAPYVARLVEFERHYRERSGALLAESTRTVRHLALWMPAGPVDHTKDVAPAVEKAVKALSGETDARTSRESELYRIRDIVQKYMPCGAIDLGFDLGCDIVPAVVRLKASADSADRLAASVAHLEGIIRDFCAAAGKAGVR